jgi:3-hydroxy-9,10-secoandrosta-1,3,5(10)-triene-9,17-dione monooxygenase reductase component
VTAVTSIDADAFRNVLGHFASGVTVLTTADASGVDYGMTVSAFSAASLTPPLVLACIDRDATMHDVLAVGARFAVSVLSERQEELSRRFSGPEEHRFEGLGVSRGMTGVALLDGAIAHVECRILARQPAGDHTIVVGEVVSAAAHGGRPLVHYRGGYTQLGG